MSDFRPNGHDTLSAAPPATPFAPQGSRETREYVSEGASVRPQDIEPSPAETLEQVPPIATDGNGAPIFAMPGNDMHAPVSIEGDTSRSVAWWVIAGLALVLGIVILA